MDLKRRTILIVPPASWRIRAFRIRVSFCIAIGILVLAGFACYFIPAEIFNESAFKQNQRKNLSNQNITLLQKIRGIRTSLSDLRRGIDSLEARKRQIEILTRSEDSSAPSAAKKKKPTTIPLDSLLAQVDRLDSYISRAAQRVKETPSSMTEIPLVKPLPGNPLIAIGFGKRVDPFTGEIKWHNGIDFIAPRQTPVFASAAGIVVQVEKSPLWGLRVRIEHQHGFTTVYAHLGMVTVNQGRTVNKGDIIGMVGASGMSSGPHLHYEVICRGRIIDPQKCFFPEAGDIAELAAVP